MTYTAYAGIGSRETPQDILVLMNQIAYKLRKAGLVLRTGAANGADQAFMQGAATAVELYIPWNGYNGYQGKPPSPKAFTYVKDLHPVWDKLTRGAQALHARNAEILLGPSLQLPVSFVVCWTQDGATTGPQTTSKTGGTGMGIRIASAVGVPVHNLANEETLRSFDRWIKEAA